MMVNKGLEATIYQMVKMSVLAPAWMQKEMGCVIRGATHMPENVDLENANPPRQSP